MTKPLFLNSNLFNKSKSPSLSSPVLATPTTPPSATLPNHSFSSQFSQLPNSTSAQLDLSIYIAICDHLTDDPTLLRFKQGDHIKVSNKLPSGWWEGHLVNTFDPDNLGVAPGQPMGLPFDIELEKGFFPGTFVSKLDTEAEYSDNTPSLRTPPQSPGLPLILTSKKSGYEGSIISKRKNSTYSDAANEVESASLNFSIDLSYLNELKQALTAGGGAKGLLENGWITDLFPKIQAEIIPEKFLKISKTLPDYWIKQTLSLPTHTLSTSSTSSTSSLSSSESNESLTYYLNLITDESTYSFPESWLGNLSDVSFNYNDNEDQPSTSSSRRNSIDSIVSKSSADSETIACFDPIAIPRQYRRPSAIAGNLDNLEVQSDLSWTNLSTEVILSVNKLQASIDSSSQFEYLGNTGSVINAIQKLFEGAGINNSKCQLLTNQPELKDIYRKMTDLISELILVLLNSMNAWSLPDFADRSKALIQQVLNLCRSFVSQCQMANIRSRAPPTIPSPIAASFGNMSSRRESKDSRVFDSSSSNLFNKLNQLVLIIAHDISKIQSISPISFAPMNDESFVENDSCGGQIVGYITSLLNHSGEVLTVVGSISVTNTKTPLSEKYDSILAGVYWKTAQLVIQLQSISPVLDFGKFLPIRKLCREVHSELLQLTILSKIIVYEQATADFQQMYNEIEMVKVSCFLTQESGTQNTQSSCPFQEFCRLLNTVPSRSTLMSLRRIDSKSSDISRTPTNLEPVSSDILSNASVKIPPKNPLRTRASTETLEKLHHTSSSSSLNRSILPPIPASPDWKPEPAEAMPTPPDIPLPLPPMIPLPLPPMVPLPTPPVPEKNFGMDRPKNRQSARSLKRLSVASYLKSPALLTVFNCDQHCYQHQHDLLHRVGAFIQQEPWFFKTDYTEVDLILDDEFVQGATLPRLIEYITPFQNPNPEFIEAFLLTYRSFTSTDNLFELLIKRFTDESPNGIHPHMRMDYVKNRLGPIRQRIMEILWIWLDVHFQDDEFEAIERLERFATGVMTHVVPEQGRNFITLLKRRTKKPKEDETTVFYKPWGSKVKRLKLDIHELSPIEFAHQLTMIESFHFKNIEPRELLNMEWEKPLSSKNFNIQAMMFISNCISSWVVRLLTETKDTNRKSNIVKFFVQLASNLRLLNNFNGLMSVLAGFNAVPVERLAPVWTLVDADHRDIATRLARVMDPHLNFGKYRELLGQARRACIPFLGVFQSDLKFIEENNPNYLPDNSEMINFDKQRRVAAIIKEVKRMQKDQANFNFKFYKPFQDYLHTLMSKSDIVAPMYPVVKDFNPKLAHLKIKSGTFAMDNFLSETGMLV